MCRLRYGCETFNCLTMPIQLDPASFTKDARAPKMLNAIMPPDPPPANPRDYKYYPLKPRDERPIVWELSRPSNQVTKADMTRAFDAYLDRSTAHREARLSGEHPPKIEHISFATPEASIEQLYGVPASPGVMALIPSNQAMISLLNAVVAVVFCLYTVKYMGKDKQDLGELLSIIYAAKQHINAHPSVAEDSGTFQRNTMHFVTRVVNRLRGLREVGMTTIMSYLLGLPYEFRSHEFVYLFAWQLCKAALALSPMPERVRPSASVQSAPTPAPSTPSGSGAPASPPATGSSDPSTPTGAPLHDGDSDDAMVGGDDHRDRDSEGKSAAGESDGDQDRTQTGGDDRERDGTSGDKDGDGAGATHEPDTDDEFDEILARMNLPEPSSVPTGLSKDASLLVSGGKALGELMAMDVDAFDDDYEARFRLEGDDGLADLTVVKGKPVATTQFDNYRHRGPKLKHYCAYEYSVAVKIVAKAKRGSNDDDYNGSDEQRRKPNARFDFAAGHPLRNEKLQQLRSKFVIPILAGPRPPRHPGPPPADRDSTSYDIWEQNSDACGAYILTLFEPLNEDGTSPIPLNWQGFEWWMTYGESVGQYDVTIFNHPVQRSRRETADAILRGLSHNSKLKRLLDAWRERAADHWNEMIQKGRGDLIPGSRGGDGGDAPPDERMFAHDIDVVNQIVESMQGQARGGDDPGSECQEVAQSCMSIFGTKAVGGAVVTVGEQNKRLQTAVDSTALIVSGVCSPAQGGVHLAQFKHDESITALKTIQSAGPPTTRVDGRPVVNAGDGQPQLPLLTGGVPGGSRRGDAVCTDALPEEPGMLPCPLFPRQHLSETDVSDLPIANQSPSQNRFFVDIIRHFNYVKRQRAASLPVIPLLIVLHGGPGSGKTYVIQQLQQRLPANACLFTASTGAATRNIDGCVTIQSTCKFTKNNDVNTPNKLATIALNVPDGCTFLVLDEVSMIGGPVFEKIEEKLRLALAPAYNSKDRQQATFGGLSIIFVGDFFQLPPVLQQSLPKAALEGNEVGMKFREFLIYNMSGQQRSCDDAHTKSFSTLRDISNPKPVTQSLLTTLYSHTLTSDMVAADKAWIDAPIVVGANDVRATLNKHKGVTKALENGIPMLAWFLPLVDQEKYSPGVLDFIQTACASELMMYFVAGAPAMIMQNSLNVRWGLANGTSCVMYSITLDPEDGVRVTSLIEKGQVAPGEIVMLKHNPVSVNVLVESEFDGWPEFCHGEGVDEDDAGYTVHYQGQDIRPGSDAGNGRKWVLVPAPPWVKLKTGKLTSLNKLGSVMVGPPGSKNGRRRVSDTKVLYCEPVVELAFSLTFHKTQGGTVKKVILYLQRGIHLPHLYVGLTRVKRGADYAVLPGPLEHLLNLNFNADIKDWMNRLGPIDDGSVYLKWDNDLAVKASAAAAAAKGNTNTRKSRRLNGPSTPTAPLSDSHAAAGQLNASASEPMGTCAAGQCIGRGRGRVSSSGRDTGCGRGAAVGHASGARMLPSGAPLGSAMSADSVPVVGIRNPSMYRVGKTYCYLISLLQVSTIHNLHVILSNDAA